MSLNAPIISPAQFNPAFLKKASIGKSPAGKTSSGLHKLQYNGFDLVGLFSNVTVSSKFLGYYDNELVNPKTGKKGNYVWDKPADQIPVNVTRFKLNVDVRNARLAGRPDAPADAQEKLAMIRMVQAAEEFNAKESAEAFWRQTGMPSTLDIMLFVNSNIVGDGLDADPYSVDEKTGKQYVRSLKISFTLYANERTLPGEAIVFESSQCFRITSWNQDPVNGRKPNLTAGDFFKDAVGGCTGYVKWGVSSASISNNKLNLPLRLIHTYMEPTTWGHRQQDPEEAANDPNNQW